MPATTATRPAATRTPIHLWIVGIVSLLWNAIGALDYSMTQFEVSWYVEQFTPEQVEYFAAYPAWAVAFWALGVWFAVGGSAALLLRSRFAVHSFAISLVGLAGTTVYTNIIGHSAMESGVGYVIFSILLWAVLIALLIYAVAMRRRGVLR